MTTTRAILFLLVALCGLSCTPAAKSGPPSDKAPEVAALRFGWVLGATFEVVHTCVRKGETLELRTRGAVAAHDADALEITFEPPPLDDRGKKLVAPGKSHAHQDKWPPLVVKRADGELIGFGATIPDEAHGTVAYRWRLWTTLVGFDLPQGQRREVRGEVEVGEGLLVPVRIVEAYDEQGATGHRVTITRTYEGEQTKKLWVMMQAEAGAKKPDLAAIHEATQEEKVVIEFQPKTLQPVSVDIQSTFTVTTKSGRTEKTDVQTQRDTWAFTWGK